MLYIDNFCICFHYYYFESLHFYYHYRYFLFFSFFFLFFYLIYHRLRNLVKEDINKGDRGNKTYAIIGKYMEYVKKQIG